MGFLKEYTTDENYNSICEYALLYTVVVFVLSLFFPSPYGKFGNNNNNNNNNNKEKGTILQRIIQFVLNDIISLSPRIGWMLMELPASLSFLYFFFFHTSKRGKFQYLFLVMWCIHYGNRGFIFPYLIRSNKNAKTSFSLLVVVIGWIVTATHGYLHAKFVGELGDRNDTWLDDIRFKIGFVIYYLGFFLILHSEHIQRNLRSTDEISNNNKEKGKIYKIPYGGLYEYVTNAPYIAELLAWFGFAICTWSLAGVFIFLISFANLVPRAVATHKWYLEYFKDKYPNDRKILIPYIY